METIMSTTKTMSRRLAAGCLAAATVAGLAAATPAAGATHPAHDACAFDPASLPRTADAVDGWYDQCRAQQVVATSSGLPRTPDAIDAWAK
jgi:hypothetical protein